MILISTIIDFKVIFHNDIQLQHMYNYYCT